MGEGAPAKAGADEGGATPTARARALRRRQTDAERQLWAILRDRRLVGFKFRRQGPISRYVADFACFEGRLIVELDGSQHADSTTDARRDAELAARGFRILRVWNNDLTRNRSGVLQAIFTALRRGADATDAPS